MNSYTYWKNREYKHLEQLKKQQKPIEEKIVAAYERAFREIETEILRNYANYMKKELVTMDELMKLADKTDVQAFNAKAKKYVQSRDFSSKANFELRIYNLKMRVNRLELLKATIALEMDRLSDQLEPIYAEQLSTTAVSEYQRQAGILGESVSYDPKRVEKIVNTSFHNATFSQRLWGNNDNARQLINTTVNRLILQGVHPNTLVAEVRERFGVSRNEALRLLVTEAARVQGAVQTDSYKQSGFEKYLYIAEPRACSICRALDGKTFELGKQEVGRNMYPMHPNCRCSIAPAIDTAEYERIMGKEYTDERMKEHLAYLREAKEQKEAAAERKALRRDYSKFSKVIGKTGMPSMERFAEMRYTEGAEWERLKDNYYVKKRLKDGRWGSKINPEKQAPHMESTRGKDKSYFYDSVDVQALFDQYAGTGIVKKNRKGRTMKELIDLPNDINLGIDVFTGNVVNGFTIHYSTKSRLHVIPTYH